MPFKTRKVSVEKHIETPQKKDIQPPSSVTNKEKIKPFVSFFSAFQQWFSLQTLKYGFIALVLFFCTYFAYGFYKDVQENGFNGEMIGIIAKAFGADMKQSDGITNILLMGSGGEDHEGGYLTDSIIVASVNYDLKSVSLLSIPRDLHVTYKVEEKTYKGKINHVFLDGMNYWRSIDDISERMQYASGYLKTEVEEIAGVEIHYSAYIDFAGFVKIVDELGGLDINVEKSISDPLYPGPNHTYRKFTLAAGQQNMPGNVALKYVRSRHGNSGGDFGRSYRQKKALVALKDQALSSGVLTSPAKIKSLLGIINENFWTDMELTEMISFGDIALEIGKENITSGGVKDLTEQNTAWFLYTPPRDLFGGQSVLLPCRINSKTPWSDIQLYQTVLSQYPELTNSTVKISVYNTTKVGGMATELSNALLRYGMILRDIGNLDAPVEETVLHYVSNERNDEIANFFDDTFGIPTAEVSTEFIQGDDFRFLIGNDYVEGYRKDIQWYLKCL